MRGRSCDNLIRVFATAAIFAAAEPVVAQTYPYSAPTNPFGATPQPSLPPTSGGFVNSGVAPIAPPLQPWDPYAASGAASAPPPALPPYNASPYNAPTFNAAPTQPGTGLGYPFQDWTAPQTKLIQNVSLRTSWLSGGSGTHFGMTNVDLATSMAFPFFYNQNIAPLIFTPGFNFHFLQGPAAGVTQNLPGTVYDAFGQLSWQPQFGQQKRLGADLAISVGVYTDFQYVDHNSIRILGRGIGTWTFSPQWKAALGVVYLDRLATKILPAGGFIWTPNSDTRYEILFPQPKFAQRITNYGNAEIWGYIGGEYGGGQWSIEHAGGGHDTFNYNDFRVYIGVEAMTARNMKMFFDIGYVFNREIIYRSGAPNIDPNDTIMLRGGLSY
jgi:hypothetical protein